MTLPEELEDRFEDELRSIETEKRMRYVTTFERRGIEKGLQQGILQGEASVLRRLLSRRFDRVPEWAEERLEQASQEELESWAERVLDAERLEDVFGSE